MPVTFDVQKIKPPRQGVIRTPWFDHQSNHPSNGLTPPKIQSLLRQAEMGDMRAQAELYEDIADKDPGLMGVFDTRKLAVTSKPWEILPIEGSGRDGKKQAESRREMLENLSQLEIVTRPGFAAEYLDYDALISYLLDATARGFSAALPVWDVKTWELRAAKQHAQKHFVSADLSKQGTEEYNPYEIRSRTMDNLVLGEELKPYQFLIHWYRGKSGLPSRMGLLRTLAYWYLFKNFAIKSWVKAAERIGMPLILGKYDTAATPEDIAALELAVQNLGIDGGAVINAASILEVVTAQGAQVNGELWEKLMHQIDMEFAKCVLGHSSTTESTPGKLGAEDQALQVQAYRTEADAKALEKTINNQIIRPCNLWIEGKDLCYYKIRYEAEEDVSTRVDRFVKLLGAGVSIPKKHVYETLDIPEPTEGEETFDGVPKDPLASLFAQNGRVFANSQLYANASRSKALRVQRKLAAMKKTDQLEAEYANKLANAYAVFVSGLDVSAEAADNLDTEGFIKAFSPVVESMIEKSMQISADEMGVDLWGDAKIANKVDPFEARNMLAEAWLKYQTFTLTQIEAEVITVALAKRIKDELINYAQSGMSQKEFYERILDAEGIGKIGRGHLQTVLRTNVATARSAATEIAVQQNPKSFPAWQFFAIVDDRTRPDHAALDGQVFAINDRKYWPPLDYNCRCEASPIHVTEMEEGTYTTVKSSDQDARVPKGFGDESRLNYARYVDKMARQNENIRTRLESLKS